MSVEFKSNPFIDTVIFAGYDVNYKNQLLGTPLIKGAAKKALEDLETSYKNYKANLHLNYGQFLSNVEGNFTELNNTESPSKARLAVAKKLSDLATERIQGEESKFSKIYLFFHKIGQFFQGHGLRTKGEWGIKVANKIKKIDSQIYKSQLKKCISEGKNKKTEFILNEMKERINELSDKEFKKILHEIIFGVIEKNPFLDKNKLIFYKNLNDEKKQIFDKELLLRQDWYEQIFDMLEGSNPDELKNYVSKEMINRFQSDPQKFVAINKNLVKKYKNGYPDEFFKTIVEAATKDYLDQDKFMEIGNLFSIDSNIEASKIFKSPNILKKEDFKKIKENIAIFNVIEI